VCSKRHEKTEIIVVQFRVPYPHFQHPFYPFLFLSQAWESAKEKQNFNFNKRAL